TRAMPTGGSVIVTVALSLMIPSLVGADAVTVTVPRLPVVVSAPVVGLIVAIVGSDVVHAMMAPATAAFDASNALALKFAPPGAKMLPVFGATTSRVALDPAPTY